MAEPMAYLAVNPCGCAAGVMVDAPEYAKDTAKDLAKYIRDGCTIMRITVASVGREYSLKPCVSNPDCVRRKHPAALAARA